MKKQGKRNRLNGAAFERKVRADLESKGWIVDKWSNNVEFNIEHQGNAVQIIPDEVVVGKLIPAKRKYNPFNKVMAIGTGFPDFICFPKIWEERDLYLGEVMAHCGSQIYQTIIGVECKSNGKLDKIEKEKCKWLLDNNIFSKILIASKIKIGRKVEIEYKEFK